MPDSPSSSSSNCFDADNAAELHYVRKALLLESLQRTRRAIRELHALHMRRATENRIDLRGRRPPNRADVLSSGRFVFQGTAAALANEAQVLDQYLGVSGTNLFEARGPGGR